jgi:hypothetical protein
MSAVWLSREGPSGSSLGSLFTSRMVVAPMEIPSGLHGLPTIRAYSRFCGTSTTAGQLHVHPSRTYRPVLGRWRPDVPHPDRSDIPSLGWRLSCGARIWIAGVQDPMDRRTGYCSRTGPRIRWRSDCRRTSLGDADHWDHPDGSNCQEGRCPAETPRFRPSRSCKHPWAPARTAMQCPVPPTGGMLFPGWRTTVPALSSLT